MTESAYFATQGQKECYKELEVGEYEILGTLDSTTCRSCGSYDGKHFPTKEMQVGVNAPPFHPNCRCTTIPYFNDEFTRDEKRAATDENGNYIEVGNMSYKEWKNKYVVKNNVANGDENGIIKSGARITDPNSEEAEIFAISFYEEIRHRTTDCKKISQNIGVSEEDIERIKKYLFIDNSLYDEDLKKWRRFDEDCAIAHSWQRLIDGKNIKPHDYVLIRHELYEMELKKNFPDISHDEAHIRASKEYNYQEEAKKYYDSLKGNKKN